MCHSRVSKAITLNLLDRSTATNTNLALNCLYDINIMIPVDHILPAINWSHFVIISKNDNLEKV